MESNRVSNAIRFENPFTLKVGQVFTGFGIGCGVGIGVGRPLNLGTFSLIIIIITTFTCVGKQMDLGRFFKPKTGDTSTQNSLHKPCICLFVKSIFNAPCSFFLPIWVQKMIYLCLFVSYAFCVGAVPMLNQVMSATRGATDAFSGVTRHVNTSVRH